MSISYRLEKVLVLALISLGSSMVLTGCGAAPVETSVIEAPIVKITNYDDYRAFAENYGPKGHEDDPVAPAATLDTKSKALVAVVYADLNGTGLYEAGVDTKKLATAIFSPAGWRAVNRHEERHVDIFGNTMTIRGAFNPTAAQEAVDLYFFEQWIKDLPFQNFSVTVGAGGDIEATAKNSEKVATYSLRKSRSSLTDAMVSAALEGLGVRYELKGNKSTPADLVKFLEIWNTPRNKIVRDNSGDFAMLNAVDESGRVVAQIDVSYLTAEQISAALFN